MKRVAIGLTALVILAAVGGGAFYYGTKVGEDRVLQNPDRIFQRMAGNQGGRFQGQFFGAVRTPQAGQRTFEGLGGGLMGTIEQVDGSTLVISTDEGNIRVQTTDTTLIEKYLSASVAALEVGERVVISGSKNDDGSYNARSIQSLRALPFTQSDQP
jgi:hypothetical protein